MPVRDSCWPEAWQTGGYMTTWVLEWIVPSATGTMSMLRMCRVDPALRTRSRSLRRPSSAQVSQVCRTLEMFGTPYGDGWGAVDG